MSTLKATNLSHASAASPNIALDSAGKVTFGGAVAGAGMDLITPTSVAGTGVTVSGGAVSFSASSTVSVNGCFTATYANYVVQFFGLCSNASTNLSVRLRVAGTDNTAANYDYQYLDVSSTTVSGGRDVGASSWSALGAVDTTNGLFTVTFANPFAAAQSVATSYGGAPVSNAYWRSAFSRHTSSTSFDGFSFFPGGGTLTGTLRVYGLRNS